MGWKLFGHGTSPAQLPAELRSILAQMQRERVAFETLTTGARESAQQLSQLSQPIAEAQKVVTELQGRVKALERLVPVLATLDEQTEAVSRTQRRTETQVDHTAEELKHLRGDIEQLRASFDAALALKGDLTSLLDSAGGLKSLRADADTLVGQVRDLSNTFERARQRQDELNGSGQAAAARLQAFEQRQQQVQGGIAAAQTRVTALEQALAPLGQAAANAAEENAKTLGALESRVAELRAVHDDLLARTREVSTRHDQVAQADQELRGRLDGLRDEVSRAVKRLELENQGLDAAGQRILDLRGGLTDIEARCRSLEEATRAIGDVQSQANGLVTQLGGLTETVAHLETHAEQLGRVQADAERLTHTVAEMTQRVARLERAQPAVDAALRDFSSLKGTHEEVKEGLERMRVAEGEIARAREGQAGTKAWLAEASRAVEALRAELAAGEEIRATVEAGRSDGDRLPQASAQMETRRADPGVGTRAAAAPGNPRFRDRASRAGITAAGGGGDDRAAARRARRPAERCPHRGERPHRRPDEDPRRPGEPCGQSAVRPEAHGPVRGTTRQVACDRGAADAGAGKGRAELGDRGRASGRPLPPVRGGAAHRGQRARDRRRQGTGHRDPGSGGAASTSGSSARRHRRRAPTGRWRDSSSGEERLNRLPTRELHDRRPRSQYRQVTGNLQETRCPSGRSSPSYSHSRPSRVRA